MGSIAKLAIFMLACLTACGQMHKHWLIAPRPTGGNGPCNYTPDTNFLIAWYKADSETNNYSDGDAVTNLYDRSTFTNNVTGAGTARPTFKTNIFNGYPAIRFNGSANILTNRHMTGWGTPNGLHMICVIKTSNYVAGSHIVNLTDGSHYAEFSHRYPAGLEVYRFAMYPSGSFPADSTYITNMDKTVIGCSFRNSDHQTAIWTDFVASGSTTDGAASAVAYPSLDVGARLDTAQYWQGDLGELMIFNTNMEATVVLTNTVNYLKCKYNLQ